jgi:tripartite ATP-independent transporter DctM subunit
MIGAFVMLLALGLPLAFITGSIAVVFTLILWDPGALVLIVSRVFVLMSSYVLVAVPMFVFMGTMLKESGVIEETFRAVRLWLGGLRGGLASTVVIASTIMAAVSGIIAAAIVTFGIIALPAMLKYRYHKDIALGSIIGGGSLGVLIPPSVLFVIFGMTAGESIGRLFLAGVFPGLLLSGLMIGYITIRCLIDPELGPALPKEERRIPLRQKLAALKSLILPFLLAFTVLGTIFAGVATPTEAAGAGALGATLCAAIRRRLTWRGIKEVAFETAKTTTMVLWLMFGASSFVGVYTRAGGAEFMEDLILGLGMGPWGVIIVMQIIYLILGMFLDSIGILLLTVPIFIPIIVELGFDPIWFGVLFVMNMMIGFMSPPFGIGVFYLKGVAPPEITTTDLFRSVWPFVLIFLLGLTLVMTFPQLALWLPNVI